MMSEGSLSHAYLLFGENKFLINEFGEKILQILENSNKTSPSFIPPPSRKGEENPTQSGLGGGLLESSYGILTDGLVIESKSGASIGIDAVREAIRFIWQKPIKSLRRSIFIKNAEDLTTEAQNAFLKTVEGPPPSGFIIFSAKSPEGLVKPLISRLQKVYVAGKDEVVPDDEQKLAIQFLKSEAKTKKEIIVKILDKESNEVLENFIKALLIECRQDSLKNFDLMRRLTDRFYKISEFNTNKKLQLETLI